MSASTLPPLIVEDEPQDNPYDVDWKFVVFLQGYMLVAGAFVWVWWYWVGIYAADWLAN